MARYTQTAKTTVSPAMIPNMMARIGPTSRIAIALSQLSIAALLFQCTIGFSHLLAARAVLALCHFPTGVSRRPARMQFSRSPAMCVPRQFTPAFRFLWVVLSRFLDGWEDLVHLMKTETVTRWHTRAFRLFGRWRSRLGRRAVMAGIGGRGRRGNNHPLDRGSPPSADADSLARRC